MRKIWLLAVCILFTSCGKFQSSNGNWPAHIATFTGFSDAQTAQVKGLIDELNTQAGKVLITYGNTNPNGYPIYLSLQHSDPTTSTEAGFTTMTSDNCTVWLADFLWNAQYSTYLKTVTAHEIFGHCADQVHTSSPGNIMNPTASAYDSYSTQSDSNFFALTMSNVGIK